MAVEQKTESYQTDRPLRIFLSFADEDRPLAEILSKKLLNSGLGKQAKIYSRLQEKDVKSAIRQMRRRINSVDLMMVLLSTEHIEATELWENEVFPGMKRYESREMDLIPVIARPCEWKTSPIGHMEAWMDDAPVSNWKSLDEAVHAIIERLENRYGIKSDSYEQTTKRGYEEQIKQTTKGGYEQQVEQPLDVPELSEDDPAEKSPAVEENLLELTTTVSSYNPDSVKDQEDQLDITPDVDAFAYLIASKKLEPPLSIGLFGDWGSGKSFFMQKMKEKIDYIREHEVVEITEGEPGESGTGDTVEFCSNIVQIEFNAWYYIDANLWACLVGTIFEKLGRHLGQKTEEEKKEEALYKSLKTSLQKLEDAEQEMRKREAELLEINLKIEKLKRPTKEEKDRLEKALSDTKAAVQSAMKKEEKARTDYLQAKTDLEKAETVEEAAKEELYGQLASTGELLKEARAETMETLAEESRIKEEIEQFRLERKKKEAQLRKAALKFVGQQIKSNETFGELRDEVKASLNIDLAAKSAEEVQQFVNQASGTGKRGLKLAAYWKNLSLLEKGIFSIILLLFFVPVISIVCGWILDLEMLQDKMVLIGTLAAPVLAGISRMLKLGSGALEKVNGLFDNIDTAKEQLEKMRNIELERLKKEYEDAKSKEKEAETRLKALREKVKSIEAEIEEIKKGKRLSGFIERRLSSNDYQQYLGLVSLIRDDFDKLSQFLRKATDLSEEKGVERIVLYIDDLDRCPPEKVVDVLQAIHLILAFPLFVVVVGVDVRWISKSLIRRYGLMISPYDTEGRATDLNQYYRDGATPYAYLEKIFQIPFRLKPLGLKGKDKFISYLVRNDLKAIDETKRKLENIELKGIDDLMKIEEALPDKSAIPALETESTENEIDEELGKSKGLEEETGSEGEPKTEEEKKILVLKNAKKLSISGEELAFIKVLLPVLGDSPRAVKRFINVFRLIKSNSKFDDISTSAISKHEGILVLLSIIIGSPALSKPLFEEINDHSEKTFGEFIANFKCTQSNEEWERAEKELETFRQFLNGKGKQSKQVAVIRDMPLTELLPLAHLVGRFSFRVD